MILRSLLLTFFVLSPLCADVAPCLPGELSAEDVLNGVYPYPPSPAVETHQDETGLAKERLSAPPPPGVHPRILLSPSDLPDLRRRLTETSAGKAMMLKLRERTGKSIHQPGTWENDLYNKLASGDIAGATAILNAKPKPSYPPGHYQPEIPYALVMESFDALVSNDPVKGKKVGSALAGYAALLEPKVDEALRQPLADDVWRAKLSGPTTGNWSDDQGLREMIGYHNLGYAYDFAYNFMSDKERDQVRSLIAKVTAGHVWMGCRLPHHFRNWNWIMIGMGQPLLSLAIEGEKGYDPRIYKIGVQISQDYLNYAITPQGVSTEAVGYTQFGLMWATPFYVAASRRGDLLIAHSHYRAMVDWYLQAMEPSGGAWQSHGDGADGGVSIWTLMMLRYFYPHDAKVDFLWQNYVISTQGKPFASNFSIIEPLIWATDGLSGPDGKLVDYNHGAKLNLPLSFFDSTRSSLMARSAWAQDAASLEFECRTDSVGASHEHADRGVFTFSALGRSWARETFRSVETKYHNGVLIDGLGQGFWPGPGKWLGFVDKGWGLLAACDEKPAYDWWWPKEITTEDPDSFIRFNYPRWSSFRDLAVKLRQDYAAKNSPAPSSGWLDTVTSWFRPAQPVQSGPAWEKDDRPSVIAHWTGFSQGDPRMWDEDSWPVRLPHNPVQRAFRSIAFVRGNHPYLLVTDDLQKDNQERLYEWTMMTGPNTDIAEIKDNDIILCDATVSRDKNGEVKPKNGDRELLVRILQMSDPARAQDYQTRPSPRLESIEKKDTLAPNGRTFGLDRRLVIPARAVSPNFKILLYPLRMGDPLPITTWNGAHDQLTVEKDGQKETLGFTLNAAGRNEIKLEREGQESISLQP